jgi:von willebrand factor type A domain protein
MENLNLVRVKDLVDNPTARVPVCLCLDTSGSMALVEEGDYKSTGKTVQQDGQFWEVVEGGRTRIQELQKGIELFFDAIREDEIARYSAEISIVTFDSTARCVLDFANIDRQGTVPKLAASGLTAMGEGVNMALDLLEKRKEEYKDKGVDYYQPWLVLMTDGEPNGDETEFRRASRRAQALVKEKKLTVFPIGIGKEPGLDALARFSPARQPVRLAGLKFQEFFSWLGASIKMVSSSGLGQQIKLDTEHIKDWMTL